MSDGMRYDAADGAGGAIAFRPGVALGLKLREIAMRDGTPMSALIRRAVREFVERDQSAGYGKDA